MLLMSFVETTWKKISYIYVHTRFLKFTNLSLELYKVFTSRLQLDTPLLDDRKLCWFADEHLERVEVLVEGAKGHPVAVEVQEQPETTFLSTL